MSKSMRSLAFLGPSGCLIQAERWVISRNATLVSLKTICEAWKWLGCNSASVNVLVS